MSSSRPTSKWEMHAKTSSMKIEEEPRFSPSFSSSSSAPAPIVSPYDAERYVKNLTKFTFDSLGSNSFLRQFLLLEKLNLQAHQCMMYNTDEFILDAFLLYHQKNSSKGLDGEDEEEDKNDKGNPNSSLNLLLHNLFVINLWKEKMLPILLNLNEDIINNIEDELQKNNDKEKLLNYLKTKSLEEILEENLTLNGSSTSSSTSSSFIKEYLESNSMRIYFILYCEGIIVNLLESILYHKHVIELLDDILLDLIDYIAKKLLKLQDANYLNLLKNFDLKLKESNRNKYQEYKAAANSSAVNSSSPLSSSLTSTPSFFNDLYHQYLTIEFKICLSCLSLLRFLVEHVSVLPLNILSRLLDKHDFLLLILPMIENPPWVRRVKTSDSVHWERYENLQWKEISPTDLMKVGLYDGQIWMILFYYISKKEINEKYIINYVRKPKILRIRKYITEILLDQLPFLVDIQRYLDEIVLQDSSNSASSSSSLAAMSSSNLFLHEVSRYWNNIIKNKDFYELTLIQFNQVWKKKDLKAKELMEIAEFYSGSSVEDIYEPVEEN